MTSTIQLAAMLTLLSGQWSLMSMDILGSVGTGNLGDWLGREGGWQIIECEARHDDPYFHGGVLALQEYWMDDVRIEADVRIRNVYHDPDTVWTGMLARSRHALTRGPWGGGYHLFIRANGTVELHGLSEGRQKIADSSYLPREQYVRLAMEIKGSQLRCMVNDELLFETEDNHHDAGLVALTHFGNAAAFRNVKVSGSPSGRDCGGLVAPEHPKPPAYSSDSPLSAIGIRASASGGAEFFIRDTGQRFVPKGFNHTVLERGSEGWHGTFNVGVYNAEQMEETLAAMARAGANCIRVWAWGAQNESGFTGAPDSSGLNGAYMENFTDFLRRATRHGIYVMPILDETPHNAYYDSLAQQAEQVAPGKNISGYNVNYLSPGPLAAKRAAVADFVRYIKHADEGLLNTVLGWSFSNEIFVNHTNAPFHLESGTAITSTGKPYDMADRNQRQACYDETILHWANTLSDAVKETAPDALTTVGIWTSDAHGRPPVNYLLPDDKDPRIPPRPSVLASANSRLDFLDIHIYPWDNTSKVRPEAHEWDALRQSDKPVIVGEYGVFKNKTIKEARTMMREMLEQAYAMGYQGSLHWVWDLTLVAGQTWSSIEEGLAEYLMRLDVHP